MNALNRALLAVVIGLALAVLLAEAALALHQLFSGTSALMQAVATDALAHPSALFLPGLIWLAAGAAGGAMTAGLSRCALLAVPVGLACAVPLAFTALVGMQPLCWTLALGLAPLLGALVGARAVDQLQRADEGEASAADQNRPEL